MTDPINPDVVEALAPMLEILRQDSGTQGPFELLAEQKTVLRALCEHQRVIVLKSRQQSISTIGLLYDLVHCIVNPGHQVALVCDVQKKANDLMARAAQWVEQLGIPTVVANTERIQLANGSAIHALTAVSRAGKGESSIGRSGTYGHIHISELAFIQDDRAMMAALSRALLPGGKMLVESTASSALNLFHALWHNGPGWHHVFLSCEDHVTYRRDPLELSEADWAELQAKYSFTRRDTAAWWKHTLDVDLSGDTFRAQRESPVKPEQAFVYAEGRWVHKHVDAVTRTEGHWTHYEHAFEPTVFGVDTALGVGGDYSFLAIVGRVSGKLHATWHDNKTEVPEFAKIVTDAAKTHKCEMAVIEASGIGGSTLQLCRAAGLPTLEFWVTHTEKPIRLNAFRHAVETGAMPIGPELVTEIRSSTVDRNGKYTGRDDGINAVSEALAWISTAGTYVAPRPKVDPTEFFDAQAFRPKKTVF